MSEKKLRLAIVGLGHRGRSMFQAVSSAISMFEPIAACDKNPDLFYNPVHFSYGGNQPPLKDVMPNVRFFDEFETMLEEARPDVLMVETPANCHADFCAKALVRGIHVYSDIPSVASLAEADMLWKVQKNSSAMLMTGATTCGWGFVLTLQDLCRKGLLGKPYYLEAEYIHDCRSLWEETPWRKPGPKNHRYPITYSTHSLGPLLSVIEEDLTSVVCLSTGSHVSGIAEAEDLMVALYQTPSGIMVRQTNSFVNNSPTGHHSFRIFGTKGFFEHLSKRGNMAEKTAFSSTEVEGLSNYTELPCGFMPEMIEKKIQEYPNAGFGHGGSDAFLWFQFAEALRRGDRKAPLDLRAGLRMTLPGIYAAESARQGGKKLEILYPWNESWTEQSDLKA